MSSCHVQQRTQPFIADVSSPDTDVICWYTAGLLVTNTDQTTDNKAVSTNQMGEEGSQSFKRYNCDSRAGAYEHEECFLNRLLSKS